MDSFINRRFESFVNGYSNLWPQVTSKVYTSRQSIPIDVSVDGNNVTVQANLPGMNPKNLAIEVDKDVLKIEANIDQTGQDDYTGYFIKERRLESVKRTVKLPHKIDPESSTSTYRDGVLKITLPKLEKTQSKRISIG
jgi:HSP20 family protein